MKFGRRGRAPWADRVAPAADRWRVAAPGILTGMLALLMKLTLAPGLVAVATLAARRAGHGVAGMISGLPVVAAPIVLVFSVQEGNHFASGAATGAVLGVASLVAFCVAYALVARRHPALLAELAGATAFAAGTLIFLPLSPPLGVSVAITAATLLAGRLAVPVRRVEHEKADAVTGDLLVWRVLITVVLVLALTAVAGGLSPHLAGLLTPFPIITSVMAVFTHTRAGADAAVALLGGLIRALTSFLVFFGLLAWLLRGTTPVLAYAVATAVTLLAWAATVVIAGRAQEPLRRATPAAAP